MRGKRTSKSALSFYFLLGLVIVLIIAGYLAKQNIAVLNPAGQIANQERNLIFLALGLCAIVVIPVFALTIGISLRYREGNRQKTKYQPNWDGSRWLEGTWWAIPLAIITVLAIVTWNSSYRLDPYKALAASQPPLKVQVVALDWKWLFIYPEYNLASVNQLEAPLNRPIELDITSDSVMNSFWVPNLGGQIYAMPGMSSQLHLIASRPGSYLGRSANISGRGFAGMNFKANIVSASQFNAWLKATNVARPLNQQTYAALATPSQNVPVRFYSPVQTGLYANIINSYAGPGGNLHGAM